MDRRDFLKSLGLGAVVFTLPKPLSIITAKMEDLKKPPLHVGYVEVMPAKTCGARGFYLIYEMGVRIGHELTAAQYADYAENWTVSMFLRKQGDRTSGVQYLRTTARMMPNPENTITVYDEEGKPYQRPHFYTSPKALMLRPDDVLEFWFSPHSAAYETEPPNYPLPKLEVVLRGVRHYAEPQAAPPGTGSEYVIGGFPKTRAIQYWHMCEVKKVLLDRKKAIELGLVSSNTKMFDWVKA
jgi:hypothetical protein